MSFGTEGSKSIGGNSLIGFIVSKATQSRKAAKNQDKKERKKQQKSKQQTKKNKARGGGLISNLPSLGNLLSFKKPETQSQTSEGPRTSGGQTGLAKILTQGFGILSTDTAALSSGLSSVTQALNSSLKAQSFTATGVQTITSILSDQLENQTSIISGIKSLKPGGGGGKGGGAFGTTGSKRAGGDTLTEALVNAAIERGLGRFITSRLSRLNPFNKNKPPGGGTPPKKPPTGGSNNPKGGYYDDAVKTSKDNASRFKKQGIMDKLKDIGDGFKGKATKATDWGKGVLGKGVETGKGLLGKAKGFGDNLVNNPITRRLGLAGAKFGGRMLPGAVGSGVSAGEVAHRVNKKDAVGAWLAGLGGGAGLVSTATAPAALTGVGAAAPIAAEATSIVADVGLLGWDILNAFKPMASGGVMVGESAGSAGEEVRSLTSKEGREMIGDQNQSGDPGMKASGASTLAVVDQFIKGMGPLGAPVSQALGPDVSNLAKTFGMSQTLPNLKLGGGRFTPDASAKKSRDRFLEDLISGSLEALGAKDKNKSQTPPPPSATNPGDTGTKQQQEDAMKRSEQTMKAASPSGIKNTEMTSDGSKVMVMESVDKIGGVKIGTTSPDMLGNEKNVMGPGAGYRPVEGTNQQRWYDVDGKLYTWKPGTTIRQLTPQEMREGWNDRKFVRKPDTGHVRVIESDFIFGEREAASGEYSYEKGKVWTKNPETKKPGWLSPPGPYGGRASSLTPETDIKLEKGGGVQKPWWDFLNLTQKKPKISSLSKDYAAQERMLSAKARASQIGTKREGSAGGFSVGGGNAGASVPKPTTAQKRAPAARAAKTPVEATKKENSDMSSATIVNIVQQSQSSVPVLNGAENTGQTTSIYVRKAYGDGLAFQILPVDMLSLIHI